MFEEWSVNRRRWCEMGYKRRREREMQRKGFEATPKTAKQECIRCDSDKYIHRLKWKDNENATKLL